MFERVAAPDYKLTEEKVQIFMRQIIKGEKLDVSVIVALNISNTIM